MKAKEIVIEYKKSRRAPKFNIKPRTGHAPTQTGAGAHKDKKKAEKQGDIKHKGKTFDEGWKDWDIWSKLNGDSDDLDDSSTRYKKYYADKIQKIAKGGGIGVQPTNGWVEDAITLAYRHIEQQNPGMDFRKIDAMAKKQVHDDVKKAMTSTESFEQRLAQRLDELSIDTLKSYKEKSKAWSDKEKENDPNPERGSEAWMKRVYRAQGRSNANRKINQKERGVTVGEAGYHHGFADPHSPNLGSQEKRDFKRAELQHELGHERNNIAVSINGKLWKVFAGKGTADSFEERQYLNHMRNWAEKKSASSGKKWTVHLTGADPT